MSVPDPRQPDNRLEWPADAGVRDLALPALRGYRDHLRNEADKIAYWRRVIQTRLDTLRDGVKNTAPVEVSRLAAALGDTGTGQRRAGFNRITSHLDLPDLPTWSEEWVQAFTATDPDPTLIPVLVDVERRLSNYRTSIHARLDEATDALIGLYRAHPRAALMLLPPPPASVTNPVTAPVAAADLFRMTHPLRLVATVPPIQYQVRSIA